MELREFNRKIIKDIMNEFKAFHFFPRKYDNLFTKKKQNIYTYKCMFACMQLLKLYAQLL